MSEEYKCAMCKETYLKARSEEEVIAECKANFGTTPQETDCDIVCDDCYKQFMGWHKAKQAN